MARPEGPLLWLHAASVGESRSLLPLIEALLAQRAALQVLVTTGTVTSAALMAEQLPARARHQFAPVDRPQAWRAFFAHWRPQLGVLVESELWPNLILEARARNLPLALVNGRISERSFRRWKRLPASAAQLCGGFALCLAQSEADRARLAALGAAQATTAGNLKYAAPPLPADPAALAGPGRRDRRATGVARRQHPSGRGGAGARGAPPPCRAAAGSADDDRAARSGARRRAGRRHPAPRPAARAALAGTSRSTPPARSISPIRWASSACFYRLAAIALVGGSLVPHGGQNPLEPARLGCPILLGPHTHNFAEIAARLVRGRRRAAGRGWRGPRRGAERAAARVARAASRMAAQGLAVADEVAMAGDGNPGEARPAARSHPRSRRCERLSSGRRTRCRRACCARSARPTVWPGGCAGGWRARRAPACR